MPSLATRRERDDYHSNLIAEVRAKVPDCFKLIEAHADPYYRDLVKKFQPRFRRLSLGPGSLFTNSRYSYLLPDYLYFTVVPLFKNTSESAMGTWFPMDLRKADMKIDFSFDPMVKKNLVEQLGDRIGHLLADGPLKNRWLFVDLMSKPPRYPVEHTGRQWSPTSFVCSVQLEGDPIQGLKSRAEVEVAWKHLFPKGPERTAVERAVMLQELKNEFQSHVASYLDDDKYILAYVHPEGTSEKLTKYRRELDQALREAGE